MRWQSWQHSRPTVHDSSVCRWHRLRRRVPTCVAMVSFSSLSLTSSFMLASMRSDSSRSFSAAAADATRCRFVGDCTGSAAAKAGGGKHAVVRTKIQAVRTDRVPSRSTAAAAADSQ